MDAHKTLRKQLILKNYSSWCYSYDWLHGQALDISVDGMSRMGEPKRFYLNNEYVRLLIGQKSQLNYNKGMYESILKLSD